MDSQNWAEWWQSEWVQPPSWCLGARLDRLSTLVKD